MFLKSFGKCNTFPSPINVLNIKQSFKEALSSLLYCQIWIMLKYLIADNQESTADKQNSPKILQILTLRIN